MTIAFTGGETGGHFYPIIAIAEAIRDISEEKRLIAPRLYFLAPTPFDQQALYENEMTFIRTPAGKMRRYSSVWNVTGLFTTALGVCSALVSLYRIYPDVIISKGGYGSVPTAVAARILGIPLIIHESDAKPGRANLLASKWAHRIAIAFDSSAKYFPQQVQGRIARTGIPVRKELAHLEPEGAKQYLKLDESVPTLLVIGGSLGSARINSVVVAAVADLVQFANVIHQTGRANIKEVESLARVSLRGVAHAERYHPVDYMNGLTLRRAAGACDAILTRAGAGAIAEIALWGKPAILVPIPEEVSHDQRTNAYAYAASGGAVVVEQANLTPHLLASETKRILTNPELAVKMAQAGRNFTDPDAAKILANEAIDIGLSHEPASA